MQIPLKTVKNMYGMFRRLKWIKCIIFNVSTRLPESVIFWRVSASRSPTRKIVQINSLIWFFILFSPRRAKITVIYRIKWSFYAKIHFISFALSSSAFEYGIEKNRPVKPSRNINIKLNNRFDVWEKNRDRFRCGIAF